MTEGKVLGNGDVVCPRCKKVVSDRCEVGEVFQYTLFGVVVLVVTFKCEYCQKMFVVHIEDSEE